MGSVQDSGREVSRRGIVLGRRSSGGKDWRTLLVLDSGVSSGDWRQSSFREKRGHGCQLQRPRLGGVTAAFQETRPRGRWRAQVVTLEIMRQQPSTYLGPPCPIPSCVFITSLFFLNKLFLFPEKCISLRSHKA